MRQEVHNLELTTNWYTAKLEHRDVFKYRYQPGWYGWERRWLQKLCFWILRKIGAFYVEEIKDRHITTRKIVYDPERLEEYVMSQIKMIDRYYGIRPRKVLMGPEDFHIVAATIYDDHNSVIRFDLTHIYYGLEVVIIPWMKGILVVPE